MLMFEGLLDIIQQAQQHNGDRTRYILEQVRDRHHAHDFDDDYSMLELSFT